MDDSNMNIIIKNIRKCIEKQLDKGIREFIIFPFGDIGMQVKFILNTAYGINEKLLVDNHLCKYNEKIKSLTYLKNMDLSSTCVILASTNPTIYLELKDFLMAYISDNQIAELEIMLEMFDEGRRKELEELEEKKKAYFRGETVEYSATTVDGKIVKTTIGKYSSGDIALPHYNKFVESIGNFCSFAPGTKVVANHPRQYITTHPIIYAYSPNLNVPIIRKYEDANGARYYFSGIKPRGVIEKHTRSKIGNDVWLGENVIICNGTNIGNGVIAGAGAVITKDVPDYAVVAGVPARIIRYRFNPEQIEALNRIKWWDWSDDEIRERYDDLYLNIDEFIAKYDK